ncbi:N-acetylmuramoyl-L-alanine amidase [Planktomarina temperata]|nr:N-acetylmuramoyl-L-alanine amidase [Planktomarina temperata]
MSPNFGPRKGGVTPSLIVVHYTAMPNAQAAFERLSDPAHEVSAHYFLDQSGGAMQLVPEAQRAWHAGAGAWGGCTDVNSASIGIELCNAGDHAFSSAQMQALKSLLKEVMQRWGIAAQGVIGHSDMAPGRKQDPGQSLRCHARRHSKAWTRQPPQARPLSAQRPWFRQPAEHRGHRPA